MAMNEEKFWQSLGREIIFHQFAEDKLTDQERNSLDMFYEAHSAATEGLELTAEDENAITEELLDSIVGASAAFNRFNRIVESMEQAGRMPKNIRSN